MTEMENIRQAKQYMEKLAMGIDPVSNQEIPDDSVLNQLCLARCFFFMSDLLGQVIANGGVVDKSGKVPFAVDSITMSKISVSENPVRITQFVDMINAAVANPQMKKLNTSLITDWLLEKGFMEKQVDANGKSHRVPTFNGMQIGMSTQTRHGTYGEYQAVYYNTRAQQFILDHLADMVAPH